MNSATCSGTTTDMNQDKQTQGDWTESELNDLVVARLAALMYQPAEGKIVRLNPPFDFVLSEVTKHEGFNRDKSLLYRVVDAAYNRWRQSQPGQ